MKNKVQIKQATPKMVKKLLTTVGPYDDALTGLASGAGIIVNRREFMRSNNIGSVKEIESFIKTKSSSLKTKLKSKNVGRNILIYNNK